MREDATIDGRFNGPPTSGNGGYSCGIVAGHITGPARVRLHVPPPLDTSLRVARADDGGVQLHDGDTLVASGEPAVLQIDVPEPPSEEDARSAMTDFPCYEGHYFPTCFVCGPKRPSKDGLELFPGPVKGDTGVWATLWHPSPDLLDGDGCVREEILWAALDCPGYFACMDKTLKPALLGELIGEVTGPVPAEDPLVVFAWPIGVDGRKYFAGTAVAAGGKVLARARSTWIELKA